MALAHPFEIPGTVQVTQNCLTAGLGMNGLVARSGSRRGWPWCVPKLLFVSDYHQFLTRPQEPFQPLFFINSVIPQAISTILTICPIFQTVINIPQTTILFPSNIIGSYHIKMKHQCMMNWMGCILKPLYLMDPSRLGCTTHIIWHLWHVMKVQYLDIQWQQCVAQKVMDRVSIHQ